MGKVLPTKRILNVASSGLSGVALPDVGSVFCQSRAAVRCSQPVTLDATIFWRLNLALEM